MDELTQPQIGQRCHFTGLGFGTIRTIDQQMPAEDEHPYGTTHLKIDFDAGCTMWKFLGQVELVALPEPAREEEMH